ncbi:MAG TPA: NYN domain-containing protein [Thermoanaerobaculia bacterium]|nr:NYN domain-containing protein [Thermoanaerobaculia bacterium]
MPYLVDGNNLIGRAGRGKASAGVRSDLIRELSDRLRRTRARVLVFFDGSGETVSLGSLSVRFSGTVTADDAIVRELARARAPREETVVTADRELARRSRDAGARVLSPDEFWSRFGSERAAKRGGASDEPRVDVEEWTRFFEDEKNRDG